MDNGSKNTSTPSCKILKPRLTKPISAIPSPDEDSTMGKKNKKTNSGSSTNFGSSKIPTPSSLASTTAVSATTDQTKDIETADSSKDSVEPQAPTSKQGSPMPALVLGNAADVPATPSTNTESELEWRSKYDTLLYNYNNLKREHEELQTTTNADFERIADLNKESDKLKVEISDSEQLQHSYNTLKREHEKLRADTDDDYQRITDLQQELSDLKSETAKARRDRDVALRKVQDLEDTADFATASRAAYIRPLNDEKEKHADTKQRLASSNNRIADLNKLNIATKSELEELKKENAALRQAVAQKEALLAGADEQYVKMQEELKNTRDQAEQNQEANDFLDIVNKDLEKSFATLGKDLTPQNLVKRFRELEQEAPSTTQNINRAASGSSLHRDISNTSLDSQADLSIPKHRPAINRKTSLGDELNRAIGDDDDEQSNGGFDEEVTMTYADFDAKFDDSHIPYADHNKAQRHVEDHGLYEPVRDAELLFHPDPPLRSKGTSTIWGDEEPGLEEMLASAREAAKQARKESEERGERSKALEKEAEEKAERIKALEKEIGARPANGNPIGTVAAPAAREKEWWEVLLGAPWWVKLLLVLLALFWATATIGTLHERHRWVSANVTPDMVRFYASPPTFGGLVSHLAGRGSGVMFG